MFPGWWKQQWRRDRYKMKHEQWKKPSCFKVLTQKQCCSVVNCDELSEVHKITLVYGTQQRFVHVFQLVSSLLLTCVSKYGTLYFSTHSTVTMATYIARYFPEFQQYSATHSHTPWILNYPPPPPTHTHTHTGNFQWCEVWWIHLLLSRWES
jgi:hypothetical protein